MKKWEVLRSDEKAVNELTRITDLQPLTAHVMSARGYNDIESVKRFFDLEELSDPFLLPDMDKAVETITQAVDQDQIICVYGDYDCDGVTSTAILYDYLLNIGAQVICYIPERSEGYGLNFKAIDEIKESGASLIITVDNGISAVAEAEYIKGLGMKLVITDHHQPSDIIPDADAIVDPYRKGSKAPFMHLAGVGVTLKLLAALDDGSYDTVLEQYGDIAAIGTVADVVPLVGENRTIVVTGLELIKNTENLGLLALLEESDTDIDKISSSTVAFSLSPRINAAGRFGSPNTALDMLTAEDDTANKLAHELTVLNERRKAAESDISSEISEYIKNNPSILKERVLIVSGDGWHHGVIGIIASRLMEAYEKPVVVISKDADGYARGSARSIKGFNIFKCFEYCSDLLVKFGGHECAGGLTVKCSELKELERMILDYAAINHPRMPSYTLRADKLLRGSDLTAENVEDLIRIAPYGAGNSEPVFAFSGARILSVVPLKNGDHTKLDIEYDGIRLKALLFRRKTASIDVSEGELIDIMGTLGVDCFGGRKTLSVIVNDYRLHGMKQEKYFLAYGAYEAFSRGEELPDEYLKKALPDRQEMVSVYKYIISFKRSINAESLYARLCSAGFNAFKLHVILDAFEQTGLISTEGAKRSIRILKPDSKVDIMTAEVITRLNLILDRDK